jgi:predicted DNA-binding WGR domain protein
MARRSRSPAPRPQQSQSYLHRLELLDKFKGHDKYWEVQLSKGTLTYRWGRRGTAGQSKTESASDKALLAAEKLLDQKLREGYRSVTADDAASTGQVLTLRERAALDDLRSLRYSWTKCTLLPRYTSCGLWLWLAATLVASPSPRGVAWLLPALAALTLGAVRSSLLKYTDIAELVATACQCICQGLVLASCFAPLPLPAWLCPVPLLVATRAAFLAPLPLLPLPPPPLPLPPPPLLLLLLLLLFEGASLLLCRVPLGVLGWPLGLRLLRLDDSRAPSLRDRLRWLCAHTLGTALLPMAPLFHGDTLMTALDEVCGVALVEDEAWVAERVRYAYVAWMGGMANYVRGVRGATWGGMLVAHTPPKHRAIDLGRVLPSEYDQHATGSTLEARQRRHDRRLERALRRWALHRSNEPQWLSTTQWLTLGVARAVVPTTWRVRVQIQPGLKLVA